MSSDNDEVFTEQPAIVKHSGAGGLAALIHKSKETGNLKDISKRQRTLSTPDAFEPSDNKSKVTLRTVSVSPTTRKVKATSLIISRAKSPPHKRLSGEADASIPEEHPVKTSKPVPKPRAVKQDEFPSISENEKGDQSSNLEVETKTVSVMKGSDGVDGSSRSQAKPGSSKPIPIPRSSTVSAGISSRPNRKPRAMSETTILEDLPESPVPKPRSIPKVDSEEKEKAVKTLQALLPAAKTEETRGSDGLTRTERSLLQMQQLMAESGDSAQSSGKEESSKPKPKVRTVTVSEPIKADVAQTKSDLENQQENDSKGETDEPETKSIAPSPSPPREARKPTPPREVKKPTPPREVKKPTPPRPSPPSYTTPPSFSRSNSTPLISPPLPCESRNRSNHVSTPSPIMERHRSIPPKEDKMTRPSPTRDSVIRPSPTRELNAVRPSPTREGLVTRPSPSREDTLTSPPVETRVIRPSPPRESNVTRPLATQGTPSSSNQTTADTGKRDSQTPPTRPPLPSQAKRVVGKKATPIKSDVSWIKRKDSIENYDSRSTISTSETMPDLSSSPIPEHRNVPYRSHAIIPTPAPASGSTYIAPTGLLAAPKITLTRGGSMSRSTASVNSSDEKRRHSFTRSTSDDDIASVMKNNGGAKSGAPPKKPPRMRLLKGSGDNRPISMIDDAHQYEKKKNAKSKELSGSFRVGTLPRELEKSPKEERKVVVDSAMKQKPGKKGLFHKLTIRHKQDKSEPRTETPTVVEEPEEPTDSSSDDEKGGTIRRMPKLRHVDLRSKSMIDDDGESEYHQLFEYVFVVGLKSGTKGELKTEVTYTFPPAPEQVFSGKDAALLAIPQFCFPDIDQWKPTKSYNSESFSFVLTDMEGGRRFGYCRRLLPSGTGPRLPEVYCIVSPLGCFSLYENILDEVETRRAVSASAVFTFLKAIQANPFPRPGRSVQVRAFGAHGSGLETVTLTRPMDSRLEHVDFSLLFSTLSVRKIIKVFSSLLMERRVILSAHSLSLLTGCAHALLALLYPFEWQHVFIPVLPNNLIDFVCSPLPYIIGINPSTIRLLGDMEMEEALVVDLEKKKFVKEIGDEPSILPTKLSQYLEHALGSSVISAEYIKKQASASNGRADEIVVNTFMLFFAYLYGGYGAHMKVVDSSTGAKEFQRAQFVKTFSSKSTRRFLEAFQMTQLFENFIEQRENPAKIETTAQSHFEKQLPVLAPRCQEIEIFSSKSKLDRWKLAKGGRKKK